MGTRRGSDASAARTIHFKVAVYSTAGPNRNAWQWEMRKCQADAVSFRGAGGGFSREDLDAVGDRSALYCLLECQRGQLCYHHSARMPRTSQHHTNLRSCTEQVQDLQSPERAHDESASPDHNCIHNAVVSTIASHNAKNLAGGWWAAGSHLRNRNRHSIP